MTTDLYYSAAWQVLEERVASGGTSVPRVQYVWSPVYVDALILRDCDTNGDGTLDERLYVVQDANYNVVALFDNAGTVVERYVYDPFGQVTVLDANWSERAAGSQFGWFYLHQGGRFDATSGLYHFRHRDYSPTLGRWTSLDPILYAAGDVNLYRVVFNAPTVFTDPSGELAPLVLLVVAGAGAEWWLLGPGAGTVNAPAPGQEGFRPPPRPFLEDAVAGIPGAIVGGGAGLVAGAVVPGGAPTAFDPFVGTGSPSGFGRLIGWGSGAQQASARTASITLQEIQQAGITRPVAEYWLNFYRNAVANGRGGATAVERVKLMQRVLELLGG